MNYFDCRISFFPHCTCKLIESPVWTFKCIDPISESIFFNVARTLNRSKGAIEESLAKFKTDILYCLICVIDE